MFDHEKMQNGRAWAYLAGILAVLVVTAYKYFTH
jgi:uncharacterized membrane protein YdcZ (DUF606 family)